MNVQSSDASAGLCRMDTSPCLRRMGTACLRVDASAVFKHTPLHMTDGYFGHLQFTLTFAQHFNLCLKSNSLFPAIAIMVSFENKFQKQKHYKINVIVGQH